MFSLTKISVCIFLKAPIHHFFQSVGIRWWYGGNKLVKLLQISVKSQIVGSQDSKTSGRIGPTHPELVFGCKSLFPPVEGFEPKLPLNTRTAKSMYWSEACTLQRQGTRSAPAHCIAEHQLTL